MKMAHRIFTTWTVLSVALLSGCATTPSGDGTVNAPKYLVPSASARFPAQLQKVENNWIHLADGPYQVEAQAEELSNVLAVRIAFLNNSEEAILLDPAQITLTDGKGVMRRKMTLEQMTQPLETRASKLESQSQAEKVEEDRKAKEDEERRKAGKQDAVDGVFNLLTMGSTPSSQQHYAQAQESRREAERLRTSLKDGEFFGAEVPPGQKLAGTLYFELPHEWPASAIVRINKKYLIANFSPPPPPPVSQ